MNAAMQRLAGRRILITGAGAGIGRATARLFAAEGARVALLDRDGDAAAATAAELDGFASACDVADGAGVERVVAEAEAALGGLDGVINAAGIFVSNRFEESPIEEWMRVIDVNLNGTMRVCRAAVPALRRAERGTIVNIASVAAFKPPPAAAAYAASKAAVLMLGKCLAVELGPDIRVNTVCPGTIETAMTAGLLQDNATSDRLMTAAAVKRFGAPTEVSQAMLFLTSDEAAYVNGATLTVDGGFAYY